MGMIGLLLLLSLPARAEDWLPPLFPEPTAEEEAPPWEAPDSPAAAPAPAPTVIQVTAPAPVAPPPPAPSEPAPRPEPWRFAFYAVLAAVGTRLARNARDVVQPYGLLSPVLGAIHGVLALLAVGCGIVAGTSFLPVSFAPALPLMAVAVALAVGWSARELLWDVIAGVTIRLEHRVRPGLRLEVPGQVGVVESVGLRATWLRDPADHRIAVPNRLLLSGPVVSDADRWPAIEIELRMPPGDPRRIRDALEEAVLLCPWVASRPDRLVSQTEDPTRWRVRARVLEDRFAPFFESAMRERAHEIGARLAGAAGD